MKECVDHARRLRRRGANFATAKIITAPCRICTISIGTSLNSWMVAPAEDSAPNRIARQRDAERGIATEQRDRDAGEAIARREPGDESVDEAERMDGPGEPADRARDDHHPDTAPSRRRSRPRG